MYIDLETGVRVSKADMQNYANQEGLDIEEYISLMGFTLESDNNTSESTDTNSADLLDPTFQKDAAADAGVVSQPMTASQAGFTESPSVDTSLDSPDPEPRFIEFKGKGDRPGAIVYEDTYLETKAGQPGYPDTFDEYAAAFNTTPQSSSTEEIAIKATSNEKVFESLNNSFKGVDLSEKTSSFDLNPGNTKIYNQEEEVVRPTLNKLFEGTEVDFVETDIVQEGDVNAVIGSEALRARIKNPETGEYIYSEILELESDGSFKNNDKIEKFLDENKSYLDLPKWTRSKNKMIAKYKQWKNSELDPIINKARVEAEQAYIVNPDLFKPYDKKINVGGYNTSTTVTETINPYQKEIAEEVNRLERKGVKGNLEAQAKINVRQNLKQADINEAIRETRAKFINASSNKEEAQAFLYASETFVKQEKAKAYNENNKSSQISAEGANKNNQMQKTAIDVFSATPRENQSVDDFITQQKNKLQPIIDELNIEIPEDKKEKINSPKLNMLLGLDEEVLLPKSFYNIMMALEDAKNANISDYNNKRIKMAESIGDISDIDVAMEATAKNYELVEKYAVSAGLGFQDIAVNTAMLGLNILSLGQSEKVAELGSDYVEYTKEIRDSYQRDVSFDEAFSTPENTGKFIAQEVANQLPIFLAMAASGGSAAYVIGASSAGGKMMDMQNEIATGTAEYSPIKLWGTSLGYGLAEGLFAQVTTVPILKRAKLNWMNNGKESVVNNSMKTYAKTQYKGLIYEPILEASGEAATVGVQNLIDGKPFMQGMDHASTSGLAFGFAFAAIPFLKGMYNSQFSTYETRSEIRTMQNKLDDLNKELNLNLFTNPNLSDKSKSILKGKQNLLKQSIEEKSTQLADKIKQQEVIVANNLTEGAKNEVVKIINKQAELENIAIEIQKNPNISNKERAQLIAEVKSQYDVVVKARNEAVKDETMLKNGTEWAAFKGLNRSESQEYLDTADATLSGERNGKQASKEDINDRAYDLYFGDKVRVENKKLGRSNSSLFKNFKSFDTVDEAITEVNNDDTIASEDKKEIILKLKNGNDGYWNRASGTMVAIVENQVKNQRKYIKTHEVGHKAFEMLLGNPENSAAFKGISDQLLSTLKATDRKTYDKFIKDGIDDDAGNIDPTEVISRFMEYVADDQITNVQKAKGISGLFGVMIQKTFGSDYKFDFRGEQDIFNFVVGFGKKLKDGTLTTADIKKAKESKVIKDLPTSDITTTTDKGVSFSKAPLLDKINSLVPPSITTQEEYFSPKIFNEVFKATEEGGAISNYIKSKASSKEAGIKTIKSIQERLTNYDPAAERKKAGNKEPITFGEFIFSNTPFAIRDAKKALFKESEAAKKKADLDSKEVQGKTVEEDSGSEVDTRKKYKPLISNPKLIPSFISSEIKTKLANVAGKLKSKLSDRPKGKNAQTTPLVAEIKKAIGNVVKDPKALPKQIINRMGNPKDGSYQKFLIDNKKSILENMTTTYLQSAIPAAIEKSVGGTYALDSDGKRKKDSNGNDIFKPKFVPYPEWVGKEIDREKVSTNKKGGTSGNQIVRRAIQVEVDGKFEDSITDENFVANFVGSDGKVIRGKRESLGKALAEEAGFEVFVSELKNDKVVTQKDLDEDIIGQFEGKQAGDFVSDVRQEFKDNQEALGEILGEDTVALVSRDIERGTVKFSKGKRQALVEIANARSSKQVNKIIGIEKQAINNKNRVEKQKEFEGIITKYNLSLETFDAGALKNSGAIRTRPRKSGPDANKLNKWLVANPKVKFSPNQVWYALSNGDWIKATDRKLDTGNIVYDPPTLEAIAKISDGNVTLVANTNRLYYGVTDPAYVAARKLATQNSIDAPVYKTGRVTTKFFSPKAVEKFAQNMLAMERVAYELQDAVAAGMPKEIAAMIIEGGYQATSGFIKIAAGFKYRSKVFEYALSGKPNQTKGKKYREEHNPPASTVGGTLLWAIVNNQVGDVMPYVKKNYYQTQLSVKDDAKIDAAGLDGTLPEGYSLLNDPVIRLIKSGIGLSSLIDPNTGISMDQEYGVVVDDNALQLQPDVIEKQGELVERQLTEPKFTKKDSQKFIDQFIKLAPALNKANIVNNKKLAYPFKEKVTSKKLLDRSNTVQKAINNGRSVSFSSAPKKIRVFDFDDTLARTNSNVLYTMPDGTEGSIDAATFAKDASMMQAEGAIFDFSEFSKVMDGKKGPLFEVAKKIAQARGTKDVFVLTARPQDAAGPIQEFLAELGLDIPLKNITGLADGDPKAKANWMVGKVAEGYNDFYFADDHLGNVKAVKDVFNTFDVKGKVQQAKIKFSKGLDKGFNDMIERQTGTESFKEFSKGVAQRRGKKVGKFKIFVSPSAEDFRGLTQYKFAGKGKQGEADQKFFEEALMDPYFKGVAAVEAARETIKNDTKALFKIFKPVKKKLNKLVPGIDFTYDGAVRVYLWNKAGIEIPGLTKRDNKKLNDTIANDPELSAFADALLLVSKQDTWPAPTEYWEAKTTLSDLNTLTEKTNRKEYLTEFIENVDIIFSEKNLNKVEALYGKASRVAIENAIYAMKTGSNSPNQSGDGITNSWLKWVNNSIGTIMFFNRRSALLQLTSTTNFLNWSDNNPAKAALAFANQPQYWKDWAMIFNSDKLKQRRSGLKSDVQESEIANAAKNTEDKIGSIIAYLLKIGFSPTQIADSIAISSGGATFYRNRVNSLKKKGMSVAEAEAKAFEDFSKLSDEAQQSGDPALVSQQQRSVAGRLILSFQNTTMQYTRLMKKAGQDLINRRGDDKTNVSKILYYGALQNLIFNALSQTAFALIPGFDEDEDEDEAKRDEKLEEKASRVLNGMTDSIIRGTGIYGAVVTTIKNTFNTWKREADKGFKGDQAKTILEAANISPAIGSKLRKIYSAIQAYQFDKAVMEKHPWSVTIDGKFNPSATYSVIGSLASATLNLPLDRALAEARGVAEMFDNRNSEMQRIALALGWRTWNVGAENEEFDLIKMEAKQAKKDKKAKEKQDYKDYLRRVFDKLSYEETQEYFTNKKAAAKKEWILKIGKEKGIK